MKNKVFPFVLVFIIFASACSVFQKDSFEGKWQLKLTGSIDETFEFVVSDENSFSVNKTISYGSRDYDVELKGKIEKDGRVNVEIVASGQTMGNIEGLFNYENGKGKWSASILFGEWTAVKK